MEQILNEWAMCYLENNEETDGIADGTINKLNTTNILQCIFYQYYRLHI